MGYNRAVTLDRPFFVIGAPRSGTTYLAKVLDRHPGIVCTDETRVMTWINRALNDLPTDKRAIQTLRDRWIAHLETELPGLVARFYEGLGARSGVVWGDKNPHYADPKTDPAALQTIDRLFPRSRFIHIVRDGRNVVVSLMAKGWALNVHYGVDVWQRHVTHSRDFGRALEPGRFLELRYEDIVADEVAGVKSILDFLEVPEDDALTTYLRRGGSRDEPVSAPITPADRFGAPMWTERLRPEELAYAEHTLADLLVEYGYETPAWRERLLATPPPELPKPESIGTIVERARASADPAELSDAVGILDERRRELERDLADARRHAEQARQLLARERASRPHARARRLSAKAMRAARRALGR